MPIRQLVGRHTDDVGEHLVALVQRDDRRRIGRFELRRHRPMNHRPAVDLAEAAARAPNRSSGRKALAAVLGRREVGQAASRRSVDSAVPRIRQPSQNGALRWLSACGTRTGLRLQGDSDVIAARLPGSARVVNKAPAPPLLHNAICASGTCSVARLAAQLLDGSNGPLHHLRIGARVAERHGSSVGGDRDGCRRWRCGRRRRMARPRPRAQNPKASS